MLARCVRARGSLAQRALSWTPACRLQHAEADASSSALDDAAESFRESVHEFAQKQVAPHAAEIDATNAFPKHVNLWTAMGDFGLHGERTGRLSVCKWSVSSNWKMCPLHVMSVLQLRCRRDCTRGVWRAGRRLLASLHSYGGTGERPPLSGSRLHLVSIR